MSWTLGQEEQGFFHWLFFGDSNGGYELGAKTDHLFMFIWWFGVFWFVLLMGLMVWWCFRYRRRRGEPTPRSPHHNTKLEIAWTVLPSLTLIYLFFAGLDPYLGKLVAPQDAEVISITGFKWSWRATYSNGANPIDAIEMGADADNPVIVVPAGRPILFKIQSQDVIHSFWIPDFRMKMDALPNRMTSYWIEPQDVGDHHIFCAEYCGDSHSEMAAMLRVVPNAEYLKYLGEINVDKTKPVEAGLQLVKSKGGCFSCHSTDGSVLTGPSWKNIYGNPVQFTDGSEISQADIDGDPVVWDNYIRESMLDPNAKMRVGFGAGGMTPFRGVFTDEELHLITVYIASLSDAPSAQAMVAAARAAAVAGSGEGESGGDQAEGANTEDGGGS